MNININDVYKTVQAILNKEQRGYLSPLVFNEFAEQAQLEIFEGYFYDKSHFLTSKKGVDGTQIMSLQEKLDLFMVYDSSELTYNNTSKRFTLPVDEVTNENKVYRLCDVYYNCNNIQRIVDKIDHKGSRYVRNSKKTQGSATFPKYLRFGNELQVLPDMAINTEEFIITDINTSTFTLTEKDDITSLLSIKSFREQDRPEAQELEPMTLEGTLLDGVVTITSEPRAFEIGDEVSIEYMYDANITIDYYKRPDTPNWNYIGSNNPIYIPKGSVDFEIHPSDQYVLVLKILEYAGAEVKDVAVVQYATQELQADNVNKKS